MRQEQFVRQLREVWVHGDQFHRRLSRADDPVVAQALEELGTALEELRVTEEQLRSDQVDATTVHGDRERYRALFEQAPIAYLVTDQDALVLQANLRASSLLGVERQWLIGKPLVSFVQVDARKGFRQRLLRRTGLDDGEWDLPLQPRHGGPVRVRALTGALRDPDGGPRTLGWVLRELPSSASGLADLLSAAAGRSGDGGAGRPRWEALWATLQEVAESVTLALGSDGAGLMLADADGRLGWATATDESCRAFEQAQQDLGRAPASRRCWTAPRSPRRTCATTRSGCGWHRWRPRTASAVCSPRP
jgi:PAS domain S-box-containing protein